MGRSEDSAKKWNFIGFVNDAVVCSIVNIFYRIEKWKIKSLKYFPTFCNGVAQFTLISLKVVFDTSDSLPKKSISDNPDCNTRLCREY